ncbi:hypothetical protein G6F24_015195 [Rhizopus arrhizus]|nr:hypothetical protein G6F24_015195 [Rhizopus arrhizus]
MKDDQTDQQRREFDAGLPAALQPQAAFDRQCGAVAPAAPGTPAQRRGKQQDGGVRQPALHGGQRQPAVGQQHGRQRRPRLPHVRQPQQQAVPDEQLQQHRRVAQRRDDGGGAARGQGMGRQAHEAQRDAQGGRKRNGHGRHGQRIDQAGRDGHPVRIVGRDGEQAFRNTKARGLEQEAESALDAARRLYGFNVQQQHGGHAAQRQDPGYLRQPAAQRARRGEG